MSIDNATKATYILPKKKVKVEVLIDIKSIKKSFGDQIVLKDISLQLFKGENLVILGRSGSGKSVLIKCIVGLLLPDSGTVCVFGQNVAELDTKQLSVVREKIGFLFQSGALYDSMTVKENLGFPLRKICPKLSDKEMDEKINDALSHVGLMNQIDKMPSQLSGGMRKRVSLARTLVMHPGIMLYDEPTTGLDPVTSDEISQLINDVKEKYKTSSIIITHDINCAIQTGDRMIMLRDGEIYKDGNTASFISSSDPFIKSFFK
jgi:phospholipid/cholesterol/gamma-HCH transport system ATP-binding protein